MTNLPKELYYLDDNFSIRSLRKYQLKEILAAHHIPYLRSITRNDLIHLFKKHIEPRKEEIIAAYQKKQQEQPLPIEEYGRGHRAVQKPTRFEDEVKEVKKDKDGFAIPSVPKRAPFNPEDSFGESEVESTPIPRKEPKKQQQKVLVHPPKTKKPKKKVQFNPDDSFASEGSDDDYTEPIELDDEQVDPDYDADADVTDESEEDIGEIDKEELVLLYKDQAVPAETLAKPYPIKTRSQKLAEARQHLLLWKTILKRIGYGLCIVYMVVGIVGLSITAYARQQNGYCTNHSIHPKNVSFLFSLLPSPCVPCPDHGVCTEDELICDPLYEKKTPFYNIGHRLPIADDCIHNSVLGKYVAQVERKIKQQLAIKQGELACQHLLAHPDSTDAPVGKVLVKDVLSNIKAFVELHLPQDRIEEIMVIALSAVLEDPKIHYWEIEDQKYLGTEEAVYSTWCKIQRVYQQTPFNIKIYIIAFLSVLLAVYGASRDYRRNLMYQQKMDTLVKSILDQLKQQHDKYMQDSTISPTVPVPQLRSCVVDVNNNKTIQDWLRVVEKIESHPHVRKSFKEVRGEPVEYWELTA